MTAPNTVVGRIHAKLDLPGGYAMMRAALRNVMQVHRAVRIYDECGHHHEYAEDGTVPGGLVEVDEVGLVCEAGYAYSICSSCCCGQDGHQHEVCADQHRRVLVGQMLVMAVDDPAVACWPCSTVRAIAEALGVAS